MAVDAEAGRKKAEADAEAGSKKAGKEAAALLERLQARNPPKLPDLYRTPSLSSLE